MEIFCPTKAKQDFELLFICLNVNIEPHILYSFCDAEEAGCLQNGVSSLCSQLTPSWGSGRGIGYRLQMKRGEKILSS